MRLFRVAARAGLAALLLYTAALEIFKPARSTAGEPAAARGSSALIIKTVIITLLAVTVVLMLGGILIGASGLYNIAADQPHFEPVAWLLKTAMSQSVRFHTIQQRIPNLRDPSLVRQGLSLSRKNCQPCHGAPGIPNDASGRGINPKPPFLADLGNRWTDLQLFWIVSHGLKMSGMPGFDERLSERDRWATVAFLRRAVLLSPDDYARLVRALDSGMDDPLVPWVMDSDLGFQQLATYGNATRGRMLVSTYGCAACHTIAGAASGKVGPPLSDFADRQYIAGLLVNAPVNLVAWIRSPHRFKQTTAMPDVNVTPADAVDLAAYLYAQASTQRLRIVKQAAGRGSMVLLSNSPSLSPAPRHLLDTASAEIPNR